MSLKHTLLVCTGNRFRFMTALAGSHRYIMLIIGKSLLQHISTNQEDISDQLRIGIKMPKMKI